MKKFFADFKAFISKGNILDMAVGVVVGGAFSKIAHALPFVHAVELERAVISGNYSDITPHLLWVLGYAVAVLVLAVLLFLRQMKKQ